MSRLAAVLGLVVCFAVHAADAPDGNAVVRAKAGSSEIVVTTTHRLAGAIHSLTWNGKEFIDSTDHGRQLQSASNLDCGKALLAETYNPTEAGSRRDGAGPKSSSRLLKLKAVGIELETTTQMAFWLAPGEKSGDNPAYNDKILSEHFVSKRVRIGYKNLPHAIEYRVTFTVPRGERHTAAVFEALTGYMPAEFDHFWRFRPASGKLEPLDDGPGEQPLPVVLATAKGDYAMGVYAPQTPAGSSGPGYGRFRFEAEKVTKWNCVFRIQDPKQIAPGDYSYRMFVAVGTREDVRTTLTALVQEFETQRIVFVGDSITDGHTYPLLVRQALAEANEPVPVCVNAGVAGDTAAGMKKRLERDVLPHKPTLVTLSVGVNDVLHKVPVAEYEADVAAIAERLKAEKIPLLILTTSTLQGKHAAADERLADYNAALRRVAVKYGCKVAEVNQAMREARDAGKDLLQPDDVHLNFEGYRVLTRALLDALGHPKTPVPAKLKLEPVPGLVCAWQIRALGEKEAPLDETTVAALKLNDSWNALKLPQTEERKEWWEEQERQRGFAQGLDALAGKAKSYVAVALVEGDGRRDVFVNTGGLLQTVWLNGKRIYKSEGWTGWHLGKERLPVRLKDGVNVLVVETGPAFALSVTDGNEW